MLPLWRLINREAAASFFPYFIKDDGIVSIISPYIVEEGRRDAKKSQRIIFTVGHYIFVAICGDTFYEWRPYQNKQSRKGRLCKGAGRDESRGDRVGEISSRSSCKRDGSRFGTGSAEGAGGDSSIWFL